MPDIGDAVSLGCYAEALNLVDHEFVFGKGRQVSLAERVPAAFGPANAEHFYCLRDGAALSSVVVARAIRLELPGERLLTGWMIGGVVTHPEYRGRGAASELLGWVERRLARDGDGFLILWTGIPAFYERLGWWRGPEGVFGRLVEPAADAPVESGRVVRRVDRTEDLERVDEFRRRHACGARPVYADPATRYRHVPLPAESCATWAVFEKHGGLVGYAVAGTAGDSCYVYEQEGDVAAWRALFTRLSKAHAQLFFNDRGDDAVLDRYRSAARIAVSPGPSCLLTARDGAALEEARQLAYIPYLDRI